MKKQFAFYFDSSSCSGCKTCQMACRDKHDLEKGVLWRRVYEVAGGEWKKEGRAWVPDVYSYYISMGCNHCEEPICMNSCPNGAISKDDQGIVLIDHKKCMGCRYCEWTCPYGALKYDEPNGLMTKCTFCSDYILQGKPPACVAACPMRALQLIDLTDQVEIANGGRPDMYPLPDPELTSPALVIKPHPDSVRASEARSDINNREELQYE